MKSVLRHLQLQREAALAQAEMLDQQIEAVEAEIQAADRPCALVEFDPRWKHNGRLTTYGREIMERCFADGMRQSEIARLFRLSMTRVHVVHKEWRQNASAAPRTNGVDHEAVQ